MRPITTEKRTYVCRNCREQFEYTALRSGKQYDFVRCSTCARDKWLQELVDLRPADAVIH